eukprot:TRINITY_DN1088_c0_g2_i3.p1 TRINITY_DN1088_c0_g2~~TRINITY_DN1088_c0_g2_i3.p1  ORF type:complete len:349 (-),score=42.93 TRINITY_DN1088_c0_g2_i3:8-1054(-)
MMVAEEYQIKFIKATTPTILINQMICRYLISQPNTIIRIRTKKLSEHAIIKYQSVVSKRHFVKPYLNKRNFIVLPSMFVLMYVSDIPLMLLEYLRCPTDWIHVSEVVLSFCIAMMYLKNSKTESMLKLLKKSISRKKVPDISEEEWRLAAELAEDITSLSEEIISHAQAINQKYKLLGQGFQTIIDNQEKFIAKLKMRDPSEIVSVSQKSSDMKNFQETKDSQKRVKKMYLAYEKKNFQETKDSQKRVKKMYLAYEKKMDSAEKLIEELLSKTAELETIVNKLNGEYWTKHPDAIQLKEILKGSRIGLENVQVQINDRKTKNEVVSSGLISIDKMIEQTEAKLGRINK